MYCTRRLSVGVYKYRTRVAGIDIFCVGNYLQARYSIVYVYYSTCLNTGVGLRYSQAHNYNFSRFMNTGSSLCDVNVDVVNLHQNRVQCANRVIRKSKMKNVFYTYSYSQGNSPIPSSILLLIFDSLSYLVKTAIIYTLFYTSAIQSPPGITERNSFR